MKQNFAKSLEAVLVHEGGYINHPRDPGGATNKGVTQAVYDGYRRKNGLGVQTVKLITSQEVGRIYKLQYWDAVKGDQLPSGVDYCIFDFAVNSGVGRATRYLQAAVGMKQDGLLGLATIDAVNRASHSGIVTAVCDARLAFLNNLKTWSVFGKGWGARVSGVRKVALGMVSGTVAPKPAVEPSIVVLGGKTDIAMTPTPKPNLFGLIASLFKKKPA